MAFTLSQAVNTVVGDLRLWSGNMTATNITGYCQIPGANAIDAVIQFDSKAGSSMTCANIAPNALAAGTAALGYIGFSNVVSSTGHSYFLTVLYH